MPVHRASTLVLLASAAAAGPPALTARVLSSQASGARALVVVDLDMDGDLDAVVACSGDGSFRWFENDNGLTPAFTARTITGNSLGAQAVVAGDIDLDGDIDLASAAFGADRIAWHESSPFMGNPTQAVIQFTNRTLSGAANGAQGVAIADLDADGRPDVAAVSFDDGSLRWFRNGPPTGKGGLPVFTARTVSSSIAQPSAIAAADVDLDGDDDLLVCSFSGDSLTWWEPVIAMPGALPTWTAHTIDSTLDGAFFVLAEDFDGDGDADLVACAFSGGEVVWFENTGPEMDPPMPPTFVRRAVGSGLAGPVSAAVYDMDGDGDLDILTTSFNDDAVTLHMRAPGATEGDPPVFSAHILDDASTDLPRAVVGADLDDDGDRDVVVASQNDGLLTLLEDLSARVVNVRTEEGYQTIASALADASPFDEVSVLNPDWLRRDRIIDTGAVRPRLTTPGPWAQPEGGAYTLRDLSSLAAADAPMTLAGTVVLRDFARADLLGSSVTVLPTGSLSIGRIGTLSVGAAGGLFCQGSLVSRGVVIATSLTIDEGADASLEGVVAAPLTVSSSLTLTGDLTVFGGMTLDTGCAIDASQAREVMLVDGDVAIPASPASGLGLECVDLVVESAGTTIEAPARLVGPSESALDPESPGSAPLRSLTILPGASVTLVDEVDNDPEGPEGPETLYIAHLSVPAGATLTLGGLRLYYESAEIDGSVSPSGGLIEIGSCPGDIDLDDYVGFSDLNIVVSAFNTEGEPGTLPGDINGDGMVGFADLNIVISAFNTDC